MAKNKKNDILQAGYDLFLEHGYDNTSMKMIAKRAGVAQSLIYAFFENKEDLLDAVFRKTQDSYQSKMYAAVQKYAHLTPEAFVELCVEVIADFRDEACFTIACALIPKLRPRAERLMKEYSDGMTAMMKPLFPGCPDDLLYDIGSLLLAVSDSFLIDGDKERATRTGAFAMRLFLQHLASNPQYRQERDSFPKP